MKKNVGLSDRAVRLVLSVGVFILAYKHVLPGNWNIVTWCVACILLVTGAFGRCPLYGACGIDTRAQGKPGVGDNSGATRASGNVHPKTS